MVDRRTILLGVTAAVAALLAADASKYELGQIACLRVDGNVYMARCEMNLNVSTWKKLRDGCPTAAGMSTPLSPTEQLVSF